MELLDLPPEWFNKPKGVRLTNDEVCRAVEQYLQNQGIAVKLDHLVPMADDDLVFTIK